MFQGTLAENGSLAEDQKAALFEELANRENTMRAEVEAKRSQQLAAVKSRMAAQRARQMEEMRERHERDKMEVCLFRSRGADVETCLRLGNILFNCMLDGSFM